MSRDGKISIDFGGAERQFRLALGELEELQELADAGPALILKRLSGDEWRTRDVRETLRLGLIGGGMAARKANDLVKRYVDDRPDWTWNAQLAFAIMGEAISGVPDEHVGKTQEATAPTETDRPMTTAGSPSPPSMAPAP